MQKLTQIGLVLISGFVWLLNQIDGSIVNKAFDQLFSLGLLVIVVVMLYREWKASQKKFSELKDAHEQDQQKMLSVIENNTEALRSVTNTLNNLGEKIQANAQAITNLQQDRGEK